MNFDLETIIQSSEIFSRLDKDKVNELIQLMEIVVLNSGETLFEKDTPSDSLFIVVKGLLAAILPTTDEGEKIAGNIRSGQTVGEMGLLTSQPRGFTIRALRQSILLKLTRDAFESYFSREPDVLMKLMKLIVTRSQRTVRALTSYYQYNNIMLLPVASHIDIHFFVTKLKSQISSTEKIIFINAKDLKEYHHNNYQAIHKHLDELEMQYQFIFYVIDIYDASLLDILFERVDKIVYLAKGNEALKLDPIVQKESEAHYAGHVKKDLVLLHADGETPKNTSYWLDRIACARYHHVHYNKSEDYARLGRLLLGGACGLVLGGGGIRGWIEVGVIKALMEKNVTIDVIGGTSIGATIGACLLMSSSYENFQQLVTNISNDIRNPFSLRNFTVPLISILSGKSGTLSLKKHFGNQYIENLNKPFFCIACNMSKSEQVVRTRGLLWKWVRASGSIPGLIPPIVEDGEIYVDGGVINNLPVNVMKDYLDGKGKIIAVDLTSAIRSNETYSFPPIITFWEALKIKLKLSRKNYKFPRYYETLVEALLMGSHERAVKNAMLSDILIQPDLSEYSSFFRTTKAEQMIALGYQLMMCHL